MTEISQIHETDLKDFTFRQVKREKITRNISIDRWRKYRAFKRDSGRCLPALLVIVYQLRDNIDRNKNNTEKEIAH